MEKVDHLLSFLSYSRRILTQLTDRKNLKYAHLIFKGFTPNRGHYYDFKKYGYKSYVTDSTRYLKTVFINYNNRDLLDDKYGCYLFLKQYTDSATPVYGLIDNGELFLLKPYATESEMFASEKKFILKPRKGRGGDGVMLLEVKDDGFYINGKHRTSFIDIYKGLKNYIINPFVQQHAYAAKIYPNSLNSIRLLSCIQDGKARVIRAGHRFGVKGTGCVDNFSSGGIFSIIDLASGIIENTTVWDSKKYKKRIIDEHPDTGERISGVQIPGWSKMIEEMIQLHESMKFIRYVGWDVAVTPTGYRIIEANYASDLVGLQLKTPLLLDEDNKQFFSLYG